MALLATSSNTLTALLYQGETHLDHYLIGSPFQSSVRLFSITLHEAVGHPFRSRPSYRPQGWMVSVHTEGQRYVHNNMGDGFSVVTEAHVTDPRVAEQLEGCLAIIRVLAAKQDIRFPETTELFLEIDQNSGKYSYWFADHAHRTIFWLHPVDTKTIGLPVLYSKRHLRESYTVFSSSSELSFVLEYALEENYWTHVEMFPATAAQYSVVALNELQIIFLNARASKLRILLVLHHGDDGLHQMLLHLIFLPSHTLPKSVIGLFIYFSTVKVCSTEHALCV